MEILGGLAGGVASGLFGNYQQKKQQSYDYYMWQQQNEYNKPVNQMKRLKEAGLNPNLVYGVGSGTVVGNANHSPTADMAPSPNFDLSNPIGHYMNRRQREEEDRQKKAIQDANQMREEETHKANLRNIDAQTEYYKSLAQKNSIPNDSWDWKTIGKKYTLDLGKKLNTAGTSWLRRPFTSFIPFFKR